MYSNLKRYQTSSYDVFVEDEEKCESPAGDTGLHAWVIWTYEYNQIEVQFLHIRWSASRCGTCCQARNMKFGPQDPPGRERQLTSLSVSWPPHVHSTHNTQEIMMLWKKANKDSQVKNTGFSCSGSGFSSHHLHGSSQPPVTLVPGPFFDLLGHQTHTWFSDINSGKIFKHIKLKGD